MDALRFFRRRPPVTRGARGIDDLWFGAGNAHGEGVSRDLGCARRIVPSGKTLDSAQFPSVGFWFRAYL